MANYSVVSLQNSIAATRSQIATLLIPGSIHENNAKAIGDLRSKLSVLEDQLFMAKMLTPVPQTRSNDRGSDVYGNHVELKSKAEINRRWLGYLKHGELRTGINVSSGAALIPEVFSAEWISALKYYSPILSYVSMADKWPLRRVLSDDTANGLTLVGEQVSTASTASDPTVTSNEVTLWNVDNLVTRTNFSFQRLEDSGFDLGAFLRSNTALRVSRSLDLATWTATDGTNALPNSIYAGGLAAFAGTASGSPTVQNATANALTLVDLLSLRNSVNRAYQSGGALFTSESIFEGLDAELTTIGTKLLPRNADGSLNVDGTPLYSSPSLTNGLSASAGNKLAYFAHPSSYQTILGPTGIRVVSEMPGFVENMKKAMISHVRFGSAGLIPQACAALTQK